MRTIDAGIAILEPQTAAHADEMFAVLSDPAIYAYENEPPASVEWLRDRFAKLESRRSPDGREQWLNWVVRVPPATAAGYVQATVLKNDSAAIAFVFGSAQGGRGLASAATRAMLRELAENYGVGSFVAVAKRANGRSTRMLERLGFTLATAGGDEASEIEPDEIRMSLSIVSPR